MKPDVAGATFPTPHICILMGVYNGGQHLATQLQSFAEQTHQDWEVLASDDGSSDASRQILAGFSDEPQKVTCLEGPRQGAAENFMSLVRAMPEHAPAGSWLAFSDQDDIWLPDRLQRGVAALQQVSPDVPALYCSRTWIIDDEGLGRRLSVPRKRAPGFKNALIQNITSGNTILLNEAATDLICSAAQDTKEVVVHDWWVYQILTGAGGIVLHDDEPTLLYRQHADNEIGANDTLRARLFRLRQLLRGDMRRWNDINIAALRESAHRLTPENRALLEAFAELRQQHWARRLWSLRGLKLYRQTPTATCALWLAALLGRL